MSEWIPVKYDADTKRFIGNKPKEDEKVIASSTGGLVGTAIFTVWTDCEMFLSDTLFLNEQINAWIPFPKPYKGV